MSMFFLLALWSADPAPDFTREIRPLLADRCFACHGPDAQQRKAGLRLDTREGALAVLESGARAIVPGDPQASELLTRIHSNDPDERMPPEDFKRPLSAVERQLLQAWIAKGAEYSPHWAFVPPQRVAPPKLSTEITPADPIDQFILASLQAKGLSPEPPVERELLLRRASLVLTGLPPDPQSVAEFLIDQRPDAYERRVDALLASPRAAEHMAVAWLDLARFADSYGYQSDNTMFSWPWRDWLLQALHENMPYDELATRMIAGDQLPDASTTDRVASAFSRLHRLTEEGGSIPEEFRQEGIADRVSTYGTAFLGLTLECARCHDHKYDPISTREFYGLASLFGRIDENGLKPYSIATSAAPPFVRLTSPDQAARTDELRRAFAQARIEYTLAREQAVTTAASTPVELPAPQAHYSFEAITDGKTANLVPGGEAATLDRGRPEQLGQVQLAPGKHGQAASFDGDGGFGLRGWSGFSRHEPISVALWLKLGELNARAAIVHASGFYTQDADASGLELEIVAGHLRWSAIHLWPGSAISIQSRAVLPVGEWLHVCATYDGSSRADGLRLYLNGIALESEGLRDSLSGPIAAHMLELGSRSRGSGLRSGMVDELMLWRERLTAAQVAVLSGVDPAPFLEEHLFDLASQAALAQWRVAERAWCEHLERLPMFMVMEDSSHAPATHVLKRGAYDQPNLEEALNAGGLSALSAPDQPPLRTRSELARWTVDPNHPLTARVAVNRLWTQVFGQPLMETSENWGSQGATPSHRELLDTLSYDFAHGDGRAGSQWNQKHLLRRLVLTQTFRQASTSSAKKLALDPTNRWLSRGPSQRLSAEMLRDQALSIAGLLVEQLGGPSVKPYQPAGLWNESGQSGEYTADVGPGAHRRSLYTFRKRSVPPPNLAVLDAGSRESCQARRLNTNTPLQALVLANDPVFFECAQGLARSVCQQVSEWNERIATAFRNATCREAETEEYAALRQLFLEQRDLYSRSMENAKAVCGAEDSELAAFVIACSTILCSDAVVVLR